jgi:membrane protease YdiL (CAAX protease family)
MEKFKTIPNLHIIIVAILPLILNVLITPIIIVSIVSLEEFLKSPFYYTYMYGPILWSIYHIFLTSLVYYFLKNEGESLKNIIGPFKNKIWLLIIIIISLIGLSILLFQIIEPIMSDVLYGQGMWNQMINEYKRIPLTLALYSILITPLTAGICEEIIWRGYLQSRLIHKLRNKIWTAIIIQAVLFGLWHSVSIHTLFTAIFGFIYGLIFIKIKRLIPIMVSHWLSDIIGFSFMYFYPKIL